MGHGGGEKYFSQKDVKQLGPIATAIILIGCASARQYPDLTYKQRVELKGISSEYLKAKSPFLMGNLWSVTDKDIDLTTKKILEEIVKFVRGDPETQDQTFDLSSTIHQA